MERYVNNYYPTVDQMAIDGGVVGVNDVHMDRWTPFVLRSDYDALHKQLTDAQATIAALTQENERLKQGQAIDLKNNNDYREQIAALQARVKELEIIGRKQIADLQDLLKRTDENREQWRKLCQEAQSQLTQHTAELEAAKQNLERRTDECNEISKMYVEAQAELERVRGELVEAAHNANVYQSLYSTGCMDRALLENELRDLRTLIAALPKVEGEIEYVSGMGWIIKHNGDVRAIPDLGRGLVAALLQHRQGMEG